MSRKAAGIWQLSMFKNRSKSERFFKSFLCKFVSALHSQTWDAQQSSAETRKSMSRKKKSALHKVNKWPYLFSAPFLIAYFLFSLYPMLYSLELSFFDWNGIGTKTFVGVQNYINLFTKDPLFFKSLKNTVILMVFSTPITVFLGLTVAYLLFDIGR